MPCDCTIASYEILTCRLNFLTAGGDIVKTFHIPTMVMTTQNGSVLLKDSIGNKLSLSVSELSAISLTIGGIQSAIETCA